MAITINGQVGPQILADGTIAAPRLGKSGEMVVQELHGRFYEQTIRGNVYSGGCTTVASVNSATYTIATLGATATPIIALWNPPTNAVNLVVLQAQLQIVITSQTAQGPGPWFWATSTANTAISTGVAPFNRKTMLAAGSSAKDLSNLALTGLTNNLVVRQAAGLAGGSIYNIGVIGTSAGFHTMMSISVENTDGAWIVPPGGVLALLAGATPSAHSASTGILWEEVPI